MEIATRRFVRPEFMNYHETLFAGDIAKWMTEAGFIGVAKTLGRTDHIVFVAMKELNVRKEISGGSVLEMQYEVVKLGTTSIVLRVEGVDLISRQVHCEGEFVFVTIDEDGKKTPHGLGEKK